MAEYSSKREERKDEITQREDILVGRNAVSEALRSGRTIDKVFAASGDTDHGLRRLCSQAKQAGAVISMTDRRKLDQMAAGGAHQGIIAYAAAHTYATVDEILQRAASQGRTPLLVICDEIVDPHNLGAILRTAECAGACGVIIPKRRSVGLTAVVAKTSAGAIEYLPVARVTNIAATVDKLKQQGVWVCGTAADGATALYDADLTGPTAIVIGNEGHGISRLVAERCDYLVNIPMPGQISSLNASAAAAILTLRSRAPAQQRRSEPIRRAHYDGTERRTGRSLYVRRYYQRIWLRRARPGRA